MGAWSDSDSYADVTERLFHEFESVHGLPAITQMVRRCRAELLDVPGEATLHTLERIARQRISALPTLTFPATDQDEEFATPPID
jgi:hypothetical protein